MKQFRDIRNNEHLNEGRLLRKGSALIFNRKAASHKNNANQHFNNTKSKLNQVDVDMNDVIKELVNGLIELTNMNAANGAVSAIGVLFNERTNDQIIHMVRKK